LDAFKYLEGHMHIIPYVSDDFSSVLYKKMNEFRTQIKDFCKELLELTACNNVCDQFKQLHKDQLLAIQHAMRNSITYSFELNAIYDKLLVLMNSIESKMKQ
jgi:hypothetical protein